MENIDISILQKMPEPTMVVLLEIEPLAPLSMVSELPGSYYKTLKGPDKKMLCGLFENILGWHLNIADRKAISKDLIKTRKKQKQLFDSLQKGSTYIPLLMEYFEIQLTIVPPLLHFDDLWSRSYRRADADVHPKGTANISHELISLKRELDEDIPKALETFFKNNISGFPLFYSTPTTREYIVVNGKYEIKLNVDPVLFNLIQEKLETENIGYLGNNEGWVNLIITAHGQ